MRLILYVCHSRRKTNVLCTRRPGFVAYMTRVEEPKKSYARGQCVGIFMYFQSQSLHSWHLKFGTQATLDLDACNSEGTTEHPSSSTSRLAVGGLDAHAPRTATNECIWRFQADESKHPFRTHWLVRSILPGCSHLLFLVHHKVLPSIFLLAILQ